MRGKRRGERTGEYFVLISILSVHSACLLLVRAFTWCNILGGTLLSYRRYI